MKEDPISIIDQAEQLINTKTELYSLKLSGKVARLMASLIFQIFLLLLVMIILFLLTMGLSLWLGEGLGSSYGGFLIVGGVLAIIGLMVYLFRHKMVLKPIINTVISQLLKENDNA